jgi:hypothetical protein
VATVVAGVGGRPAVSYRRIRCTSRQRSHPSRRRTRGREWLKPAKSGENWRRAAKVRANADPYSYGDVRHGRVAASSTPAGRRPASTRPTPVPRQYRDGPGVSGSGDGSRPTSSRPPGAVDRPRRDGVPGGSTSRVRGEASRSGRGSTSERKSERGSTVKRSLTIRTGRPAGAGSGGKSHRRIGEGVNRRSRYETGPQEPTLRRRVPRVEASATSNALVCRTAGADARVLKVTGTGSLHSDHCGPDRPRARLGEGRARHDPTVTRPAATSRSEH